MRAVLIDPISSDIDPISSDVSLAGTFSEHGAASLHRYQLETCRNDDFTSKKVKKYRTVMGLGTSRILDLLPGRTAEPVAAWPAEHGADIADICRGRAGVYAYACAAEPATPAATQIADRWHIWYILCQAMTWDIAEHQRRMKPIAPTPAQPRPIPAGRQTPRAKTGLPSATTTATPGSTNCSTRAGARIRQHLKPDVKTARRYARAEHAEDLFGGARRHRASGRSSTRPPDCGTRGSPTAPPSTHRHPIELGRSAQYLGATRPDAAAASLVWGAVACLTQPRRLATRPTDRLRLGTLAITAGTLLAAAALALGWYASETIAANPGPPTYVSANCAGAQHASPGPIPAHFAPVAVLECGPGLHDPVNGPTPSTTAMIHWRGTGNVAAVAAQFGAHRLGHQGQGEACTDNVSAFYLFVDASGRAVLARAPNGVCGMYNGAARALIALAWTQLPSVPETPAPARGDGLRRAGATPFQSTARRGTTQQPEGTPGSACEYGSRYASGLRASK